LVSAALILILIKVLTFNLCLPTGGQTGLQNTSDDIARRRTIEPTGVTLTNNVIRESLKRIRAGQGVLSPTGITFGGVGSLTASVVDFVTATSVAGNIPSPDLIQKATGVKNSIDNFGASSDRTLSSVLANLPAAINSGLDSARVSQAASILGEVVTSGEQPAGPGQTSIADPAATSLFRKAYGTATLLAQNEGLINAPASYPSAIDHTSADAPTMFNKLPDGSFQVTEIGAFALQALRSPSSAIGTNRPKNPWINPNAVNNNTRAIAAETNQPSLDISTSVIV